MDWKQHLDTADRLASGTTEGDWRSAVSRSYYAVFHFFREWLFAHGIVLGKSGESHFNLYSGLLHCGVADLKQVAGKLDDLRHSRTLADYDLHKPFGQFAAQERVRAGHNLVATFQALLRTVPAETIVNGVRDHLQRIGRLPRP